VSCVAATGSGVQCSFSCLPDKHPPDVPVLLRHTPSRGRFVGGNVALLMVSCHCTGGTRYILAGVLAHARAGLLDHKNRKCSYNSPSQCPNPYFIPRHRCESSQLTSQHSGFGGLEVACWPLVPKFAGSHPAEAVGFLGAKKSSARLPSEGK